MRKIKNVLAIVLVAVMLFVPGRGYSYFVGENIYNDTYPTEYITAVNTLFGLGVLQDNNVERYNDIVSNGDFSKYLYALCGMEYTEKSDKDSSPITFFEAIKMIVDITENTIRAEKKGLPAGYRIIGSQMDITHGLEKIKDYDTLSYGVVVQMLYNTMRVTPGDAAFINSDGINYVYDSEHTVLSDYLNIQLRSGFVTADDFWSISPNETPTENTIVINGERYSVSYSGMNDYVGYYVDYYYSSDMDKILAIEKSPLSKMMVLNCRNDIKYENGQYSYYADGSQKKYHLVEQPYIIDNYKRIITPSPDMLPDNADIVLIDGNGDDVYETVFFKKYTEFVIRSIDSDGKFIASDRQSFALPEKKTAKVYYKGKRVDYKSIRSGMIASSILNEKNVCLEIYLSDTKVTGEITSYDFNNSEISIKETDYPISVNCVNLPSLRVGLTGDYLINFKGEISFFGEVGGGSQNFAYLVGIDKKRSISNDIQVRLFESNGEFKIYGLSKKCKINDSKPTDILAILKDGENTKQQLIYYTINPEGLISNIDLVEGDVSKVNFDEQKLHLCYEAENSVLLGNKILTRESTVKFSVPSTYSTDDNQFYAGSLSNATASFKAYSLKKNSAFADVIISYSSVLSGDRGVCGGDAGQVASGSDVCVVKKTVKAYVERYDEYFDKVEFINMATGREESLILADNASWQAWSNTRSLIVSEYSNTSRDLMPGDIFQFNKNSREEIGTVHKFFDASEKTFVKGKGTQSGTEYSFDYTNIDNFGSEYDDHLRALFGFSVDVNNEYVCIGFDNPQSIANANRTDLEFYHKYGETRVATVDYYRKNAEIKMTDFGTLSPSSDIEHPIVLIVVWGRLRAVVSYDYSE